MRNQQFAPLELGLRIIVVFYKQFAPIGVILVPSGLTVCRKMELKKEEAPE